MQKSLKNRVLSLFLAVSLVLSLVVVPASAANSAIGGQIAAGKTTLTEALGDYPSFFEGVATYIRNMEFGNADAPYYPGVSLYSRITEEAFLFDVGSVDNLYAFATAINSNDVGVKCLVSQTGSGVNDYYYIQYVSISKFSGGGFDRNDAIQGLKLKYTAADENGWILVASVAAAGDVEGQWLTYNNTLPQDMVSYEQLEAMRLGMQNYGVNCSLTKMDVGYVLTKSTGTPPYYVTQAYCNPWGGMYVAPADDRVLDGDRVHIDGDGNEINVGIDIEGGTLNLPDVGELNINQTIYDDSTKTYYIDAWGTDKNGDTYVTYNYSFTYNIDYTSITYIGQTEEYNKYYKIYYELPDGRSSADLTVEELEQLNVSIDVLPYVRSTDDVHVRALYHFDGDTTDSSYWNHLSSFEWTDGASITYMDAGVFEGALYLDEQSHRFVIRLPKNIASSDFTLQWRMYQSATPAPVSDTNIAVGGQLLLKSDGSHWLNNGGTQIASIPVGTWCEYAIVRSRSGLHFFVNGLKVYSWASALANASYTNQLIFNFGPEQQTYKYFDELRVVTKALYSTDGYTPTAVPHDTNLALVLPDSKLPVADAYWSFESSKTNLLEQYGLSDWANVSSSDKSNLVSNSSSGSSFSVEYDSSDPSGVSYHVTPYSSAPVFPKFQFNAPQTSWTSTQSGTRFSLASISTTQDYIIPNWSVVTGNDGKISPDPERGISYYPTGGIATRFAATNTDASFPTNLEAGKTYTLSMVSGEGDIGSMTFTVPDYFENKFSGFTVHSVKPDKFKSLSDSEYLTTNDVKGWTTEYRRFGFSDFRFVEEMLFNGYYFIIYPSWGNEEYSGNKHTYMAKEYIMQIVPVVSDDTYNSTTGRYDGGEFVYLELVEGETDLKAEYVESIAVMDKDDINTPSLAVKTDIEITGHQIGGMRPSVPQKGLVWALVEGGIIKSLQIYNGSAWEAVDGRIWTGSRWVPYSAYNVLLLKDLYDVAGTVSPEDFEYIYTETGFWSWWQKSWLDFVSWIKGTGGTGSDNPSSDQQPDDSVIPPVDEDGDGEGEGWQFIDLLVLLKDGAWAVGKGIVVTVFDGISGLATAVDGVGGFFDSYSPGGGVFQIYEEGEGIWD